MPRIDLNNPSPLASLLSQLSYEQKESLYNDASQLVSDNRRQLIDRIAPLRTRHITVALEDVYQSHNAAAVLRSCDCFGVQDVHVVERNNPFNPAGDVAVGSSKWIDYYPYHDTPSAYHRLRDKGYRIVATTPHTNDTLITDLDISQPIALVFGTELTGLSPQAIDLADSYVKIPMYGFTESFNISVCAALSLFSLTSRLRTSHLPWQLPPEQILDLKIHWCAQAIRDGESVLNNLIKTL
jgi:tRNA (guanosine-2'-O-)-methyltransferase